jgi:hypothetical protein
LTRSKRAATKWGAYYKFYFALDFLEPKDLVKLLGLNKESRRIFRKKVFRTIFYNFGDSISVKNRFTCWGQLLEIVNILGFLRN